MKMTLLLVLICFCVQSFAQLPLRAPKGKGKTDPGKENANAKTGAKKPTFPAVPTLKENEYAVFLDDQYTVFTTAKTDDLELDSTCFKSKPIKCQAFLAKDVKPRKPAARHEGLTNLSVYHCKDRGGDSLIALNSKREEFNFCRFKDGSMVNSWSLYFKEHPIQVIR